MPTKSFDTYMAEKGQQSTLNQLRENFQYDTAKSQYEKTGSYGGSTASSPSPGGSTPRTDYIKSAGETLQSNIAKNNQQTTGARQKLIDYYSGLESLTDRYGRLSQEQGVTAQQDLVNKLTENVMNTEDLIEGVGESVKTRSKDFLMTDADRTALTAREQEPLVNNLTKLLRSKQYEEIGLAGKQALVKEMIALSMQDDARGAKPYQLGVDYTTADVKEANDLLKSLFGAETTAFGQDVAASEAKSAEERAAKRAEEAAALSFDRQKELTKLSSDLSLKNSITLKNLAAKDQTAANRVEDVWNSITARANTEYDVWNTIDKNDAEFRKAGIDVDALYKMHNELAGKTGTGGQIRSSSPSYDELLNLISGA